MRRIRGGGEPTAGHPDKANETVWSLTLIRDATPDDIPVMLDMAERFIAIAWGRVGVPFDRETCTDLLTALIENPAGILLVDVDCKAMIGAMVLPWHFNRNILTAFELFWWAEPDSGAAMALWQEAEHQARNRGATTFNMAAQEHMRAAALARIYQRRGYVPSEHVYITELQ